MIKIIENTGILLGSSNSIPVEKVIELNACTPLAITVTMLHIQMSHTDNHYIYIEIEAPFNAYMTLLIRLSQLLRST